MSEHGVNVKKTPVGARWVVGIKDKSGKVQDLGEFATREEANEAYKAGYRRYYPALAAEPPPAGARMQKLEAASLVTRPPQKTDKRR